VSEPPGDLASALAQVGRSVRDALVATWGSAADGRVVRRAGGDDIYGLDDRADRVLLAELERRCARWPGRLIVEGSEEPLPVGGGSGPWVYLADPVDGTRLWLAGKRSAWVLLGAGREAATLEELEVGAAVELPTPRARLGLVSWACAGGEVNAEDDDLAAGGRRLPHRLVPRAGADVTATYVSFSQYTPGVAGEVSRLEDRMLAGLKVFRDPSQSTGGLLMGLADGADSAVVDPRPLVGAPNAAHPYDLAALVVARAAGVVVEALPPGPLAVPLSPWAPVAWAGYCNPEVAEVFRRRWREHAPGR
jgi:fructose-1,6-bisphosphatase/inositol monophosphatase family enzyme